MQLLSYIAMNDKMFNDFLIGKWQWILYAIKAYLICDFDFVYDGVDSEAFIMLIEDLNVNAWVHFLTCP